MAPTAPSTYLGRRFADYGNNWGNGWPAADHADAMACRDLEQRLSYALHLYQITQEEAEAVGRRMSATATVYDLEGARFVESLMSLWIAPAKSALAQLDAMEAKGFQVDRASEFREAKMDIRVSLSIPVERAAEQAERFAREGFVRGKSTEELRGELRRRMGP